MAAKSPDTARVYALEDELKIANARIAELKGDLDEAHKLIEKYREHSDDNRANRESWIEAFDMQLGDDGNWHWHRDGKGDAYLALLEKYNDLVKRWNRWCAKENPQPPGRPLAASDAQIAEVRKLHKRGVSLRAIVEATSLGLQTVRTIVGREDGTDRTTIKRAAKLDPMRTEVIRAKARKRTRDGIPARLNAWLAADDALRKAAKGLGR